MLEKPSQSIAYYFNVSQGLKYIPSWVCSIAACGRAYRQIVKLYTAIINYLLHRAVSMALDSGYVYCVFECIVCEGDKND